MRALQMLVIASALLVPARAAEDEATIIRRDDEYIRQQLLDAADEALRNRIMSLFEVWMRDPTDQPKRALVGAHQAVNAYRDIVKALESRDWKIVAPPEPNVKLFPPPIEFPAVVSPGRAHNRRR